MPDLVAHYYFGKKVYDALPMEIQNHITNYDMYAFTTAGPDPFFFYKFLNSKKNIKVREFGNYMHRNKSRDFFKKLIEVTKNSKEKDLMFSYLTGFIAHYSLDSTAHPYIFHKTGEYLYNDETRHFRGLHTKLERAIDSGIIRMYYNKKPWKVKLHKKVLTLKKLPISIKDDLNEVYSCVYQKENIFEIMDKSLKSQRKFYRFIYDPTGIKNWFFGKIDNGKGGIDFSTISYYKKEIKDVDILNEKHEMWVNPVDDSISSTSSFRDLFESAKNLSTKLIEVAYNVVYKDLEVNLDDYFKNLSYLTGVDMDLEYSHNMKYFNNIFGRE